MTSKSLQTDSRQRLNSFYALHGFDMFRITGGGALAVSSSQLTGTEWIENKCTMLTGRVKIFTG